MTGSGSDLSPSALPEIEIPCYQGVSDHGELIRNQQVSSSSLLAGSSNDKGFKGFRHNPDSAKIHQIKQKRR